MDHEGLKKKWEPTTDGALSELAMYWKLLRMGITGVDQRRRAAGDSFSHAAHGVGLVIGFVSGQLQMEIGTRRFLLDPGDLLYIPANSAHSARVLGNEPTIYLIGGVVKTQLENS